ncbi:hypothetical protein LG197_26195 [Pseudomonas asiatica]|uniref:hypothetical protein n=1 Tax=Pseudomonas asiatica TaxID=2219225 RepID=UPI002368F171|nr:hypothetical protein [Pseudomonas asiatica]WDM88044.1 hypothetical protein LG197_26195 [Pseudomonas asiatica]
MSDEQTQNDFLGDIAAEATGSVGVPDDVSETTAVPNALADEVEGYQEFADRRDEHLHDDVDQANDQVDDHQDKRQRNVPLGALQEERSKRQQAQQEIAQLQQQLAAFQTQQQQALAQQQAAQREAEIPAFVDDPEGHINGLKQQFQAELDAMRQGQQQQQVQAFQAQVADAMSYATKLEAEFKQANPEYESAFEFVHQAAARELAGRYPGVTEAQLTTVQQGALLDFLQTCRQRGVNPCEQIMQRAQALGFNPSVRTARQQSARKPPTSLSDTSGSTRAPDQRGNVTAKDVAGMSNEEFDKLFESMRRSERPQFGF